MAENKRRCYGSELLCPLFSLPTAVLRPANYMQRSVFYNAPEAQPGAGFWGYTRLGKHRLVRSFSLALYQTQNGWNRRHLLHGHLGHHIKCGKVGAGEVVFVLAHLDGVQPLVHGAEAGEVWDAAVQEREMNTKGGTQAGAVMSKANTQWQSLSHRPPACDSNMNYYITFSKGQTELCENPQGLIREPIFSKLIPHKVYFPNEVIGFREQIYPQCLWKIWPASVLHATTNESTDRG